MNTATLSNKKITMATLKSFIKKSESLFVLSESSFNGMTDCVERNTNPTLIPVSKENAIGHKGVWCVGSSRDYFRYFENDTHFGIEVSNSCGCEILLTAK
jgi:hypothetical protein